MSCTAKSCFVERHFHEARRSDAMVLYYTVLRVALIRDSTREIYLLFSLFSLKIKA